MIQQPRQITISTQSIHTNSLIRLQQPQNIQNNCYSYQWVYQNNQKMKGNYILTRFDLSKNSKGNQFQCTPLDYGSIIIGRILVFFNGRNQIIKQIRYGPILIEPRLCQFIQKRYQNNLKATQIKVLLNKNISLEGNIKIINFNNPTNNQNKLKISIQAKQFNFEIKIDQNIRLPSNNSFFKFYDKQQESLGISIYHQHSELLQKLKQNISTQNFIGFYLKIIFKDRLSRDNFLINLMKQLKVQIDEFKLPEIEDIQINQNQNKIEQFDNGTKKKTSRIKEIDDEIFKLLYQASQVDNQPSIDLADAQFLLSSNKKLNITNLNHSFMKESDLKFNQKKSFLAQKNTNQLYSTLQQKNNSAFQKDNFSEKMREVQQNKSKSARRKISPVSGASQKQNQLRNTITNLTIQVKNLLKQNRKLTQQNKKLKDQNMKLRYKQLKNTSFIKVTPSHNIENNQKQVEYRSKSVSPFIHQKRQSINLNKLTDNLLMSKGKISHSIQKIHSTNLLKLPEQRSNINSSVKLSTTSGSILIGNKSYNNNGNKSYKIGRNITTCVPCYNRPPHKQILNQHPIQFKQSFVFTGLNHHQSHTNFPNTNTHYIYLQNKLSNNQVQNSDSNFINIQTPHKNFGTQSIQFIECPSWQR